MQSRSVRGLVVATVVALALAACGSGGGYQRGLFIGKVVDMTEAEITSNVGKPDRVDTSDPNAPKWVYNKKTFDPDNMNKTDDTTIVVMKKDPANGQWKGGEVQFL